MGGAGGVAKADLNVDLEDLNLLEKRVSELEKYLGIED